MTLRLYPRGSFIFGYAKAALEHFRSTADAKSAILQAVQIPKSTRTIRKQRGSP